MIFRDKDGRVYGIGKDGVVPIKSPPVIVGLSEPTREQLDFAARYANELEDLGVSNEILLSALQRASFKARRSGKEKS